MKILSNFTDYYDDTYKRNQSLVYKRETKTENDVLKKYADFLARASIGFGTQHGTDINLDRILNQTSRLNYTLVTPTIVGIAGRMFYYVEYENTVLSIKKRFYNYDSLKTIFKNKQIEKTFELFARGLTRPYYNAQFKCINFIMFMEDTLTIIKEPNLKEFGLDGLLLPEICYNNIEDFIRNKVDNNKKYKNKSASFYYSNLTN